MTSSDVEQQKTVSRMLQLTNKTIAQLEQAHIRLNSIFDMLPDIFVIFDMNGRVVKANQPYCDVLQISSHQALESNVYQLFDKSTSLIFSRMLEQLSKSKSEKSLQFELPIQFFGVDDHGRSSDAIEARSYYWHLQKFTGETKFYGDLYLVLGRDLSEVKNLQLQVSELFNRVPLGIIKVDKVGIIRRPYSKFAESLFGSIKLADQHWADVIGQFSKSEMFIGAGKRDKITELDFKELRRGLPERIEIPTKSFSGEAVRTVSISYNPYFNLEAVFDGMLLILRDISDLVSKESENRELTILSTLDPMTSIHNRRHFDIILEKEWKVAMRREEEISLLMIDIDYFKRYNDCYGHLQGDAAIMRVARCIQSSLLRPNDIAARYGGEEFVVILPSTDAQGAEKVANKILETVRALKIPHEKSEVANHVTVSIGAGCLVPQRGQNYSALIQEADDLLYEAKENGRNQVVFSQPEESKS